MRRSFRPINQTWLPVMDPERMATTNVITAIFCVGVVQGGLFGRRVAAFFVMLAHVSRS